MADLKFSYENLKKFCEDIFCKFGFDKRSSEIITDVLLLSDLYGIDSHGTQRLMRYYKHLQTGLIKGDAKAETVYETPISAVIDAKEGMGQLVSYDAMNLAIEKAEKSGIGMVTVKNSNHYGIAGYYAKMACDKGLIGISLTNTEAIMVPTFARKAMLGTNPIAVAVPAEPYPFFFDASTSIVTRGKLELYKKLEKEMPDCWALDAEGKVNTSAPHVLDCIAAHKGGGILPLGGAYEKTGSHKGYGYGMLCEIFSAILAQGVTSDKTYKDGKALICHGFIAINPNLFGDPEAIKAHFSSFLEDLRNAPKADGCDRIYTHGEKEIIAMEDRLANGIAININTVKEMKSCAEGFGMSFSDYFGNIADNI
ncbi:MAG: Ldh family oxidoreductase [Ruminococcaceae bacterium]|nr:Ldh family oxidoreductase [Oscillospiraceae bacterium]